MGCVDQGWRRARFHSERCVYSAYRHKSIAISRVTPFTSDHTVAFYHRKPTISHFLVCSFWCGNSFFLHISWFFKTRLISDWSVHYLVSQAAEMSGSPPKSLNAFLCTYMCSMVCLFHRPVVSMPQAMVRAWWILLSTLSHGTSTICQHLWCFSPWAYLATSPLKAKR